MKNNLNNRGSTLIFTVIIIFLMTLLITAMLSISVTNFKFISQSTNLNNSYYNAETLVNSILYKINELSGNHINDNFDVNARKKELSKELIDLEITHEITENGDIDDYSDMSDAEIQVFCDDVFSTKNDFLNIDKESIKDEILDFDWDNYINNNFNLGDNIDLADLTITIEASGSSDSDISISFSDNDLYNIRDIQVTIKINEYFDYIINDDYNLANFPSTISSYEDRKQFINDLYNKSDNFSEDEKAFLMQVPYESDVVKFEYHDDNYNFYEIISWKIVD